MRITSAKPKIYRWRADPLFKEVTSLIALRYGLQVGSTDLSQAMAADLVIIVPATLDQQSTFLPFLAPFNVLEFKGEHDKLNVAKLANAISRAFRYAAQNKIEPHYVLNLMITASKPDKVLAYLKAQDSELTQNTEQKWLWQGKVGPQKIALIVCSDLPFEPEWYEWLAFAPSNSTTWRTFAIKMLQENNSHIIQIMEKLRPEEFYMIEKNLIDDLISRGQLDRREARRWRKERRNATKMRLTDIGLEDPEGLKEVLAGLKPEDRLAGLKPEDRLAGLSQGQKEELAKLLQEQKNAPTQ